MKLAGRFALSWMAFAGWSLAADLTSMGSWVETINSGHLIAGAGSNLVSQIESISGVTVLSVSNAPGSYSVRVRTSGAGGHPDIAIQIRRSSSGSGSGTISGGTTYVTLSGSDVELFSGTDDRSNIALQFKLAGLSTTIAPSAYLSSIIFTVQ